MENKKRRFKRYYFITTYAVISLVIMAFGIGFVLEKHDTLEKNLLAHKESLINAKKETIREVVGATAQQLNIRAAVADREMQERVDTRLKLAYAAADSVYDSSESRERNARYIKSALSAYTWGNNYVFIFSMDGTIVSSPLNRHLEGKNILLSPNKDLREAMTTVMEKLKNTNELTANTKWAKPGSKSDSASPKYVKFKKFEKLGWVIGYGEYYDDFSDEVKQEALNTLESIVLANDGYIFAATYDGISLTKPAKNVNMINAKDKYGKFIVKEMIDLAKMGGGYIEYTMPALSGMKEEKKLSYVVGIPQWKWYIGTGIYLTDIEQEYITRIQNAKEETDGEIFIIIAFISLLLLLTGIVTYMLSTRLENLITIYNAEINKKNAELKELNKSLESKVAEKTLQLTQLNASLEEKVKLAVDKNREQEHIMFQQGRLASMGEMLSNIAHQWRQPLNNIGLYIQDIRETYETNEFNEEYLDTTVNHCMHIINHMSGTIDNFRDFFKPNKENIPFSINDQIKSSLALVKAALENSSISVSVELGSNGLVSGVPGEYAQVIVNLLSNAKDALIENGVPQPFIKVITRTENGYETAEIIDNGGGIPYEIAEKIFEPYFTTKNEGKGTGIGLYFSKIIIEKNMNGNIIFSNTDSGAIFKISIPSVTEKSGE